MIRAWTGTAAATLGVYLVQLLLLASEASSFLSPTTSLVGRTSCSQIHISCSRSWRLSAGAESGSLEPTVDVDEASPDEVMTPAGLTLEGVYKRLYVEVQGLDDGVVGLESRDTSFGVSPAPTVTLLRFVLAARLEFLFVCQHIE